MMPLSLVKNSNFLHCLFLLKIGPEMIFEDVLDRKEASLDNKKMYLIYPRNRKFSKGLTHDFCQKFELSSLFVFIENRPRNDVWGCSRYKRSLSRQ